MENPRCAGSGIGPDGLRAKVVHLWHAGHKPVIETFDYAGISLVCVNLSFKNNTLIMCLINRQIGERGEKQGKFRSGRMFCADLSTETVDSFSLAPVRGSLQPRRGIDATE